MRLPNAEDSRSIAPQHLAFIERDPRPKWFVTSPNEAGEQQVYLNFEVTGWYPKFYGPFPNQDAALKCLNELLISLAIRSMMPGWRPTSRNRTSSAYSWDRHPARAWRDHGDMIAVFRVRRYAEEADRAPCATGSAACTSTSTGMIIR